MKTYTILLHSILPTLLTLSAMEAKPQFTSLFGNESTVWTIKKSDLSGAYTDSLVYGGDTIMDNMHYYKFNSFMGPTFQSECVRYYAEDTVQGKVWFFNAEHPVPSLIMDFSLEVGDQFEIFSQFGDTFEVIATYTDLQGRYTVEFDSPIEGLSVPENFKFIEGYGPNRGIDYADGSCSSLDPYALCHYKDGLLAGHASDPAWALACQVPTRDIPMDNPISVRLWPNPGTDVLHIETGTTGRVGVQVCDATGRAVLAAWGTGVLKLSSAALSPGVYFIEVTTSEGRQTVKWMKQ
ncbi:MAG: T9SS type A sorting domain-containing protein [Flavobacteriales bacterium]|nr:T9SS type A sorting domain-containing protein [Flavobacteriales bacterium]